MFLDDRKIAEIQHIVKEAGEIIREYYHSRKFTVGFKRDLSPRTEADQESNRYIVAELTRLFPGTPVISEEIEAPDHPSRAKWERFWIVDPLDGTEGFIGQSGQFTVNVALVEGKKVVFGIINLLNNGEILWGARGRGCWNGETRVAAARKPADRLRVAVSRTRVTGEELQYIAHLQELGHDVEIVSLSAAYKYCMVATGEVDLALKFGGCREWDVAAGQALVEATGGLVVNAGTGRRVEYNTPSLQAPPLVMFGKRVHGKIRSGCTDFQEMFHVKTI
jgi:3'(2'), 5'-bisphosphate nucleotidase